MSGLIHRGTRAGRRQPASAPVETCQNCGHPVAPGHHVIRLRPASCHVVVDEYHATWGEQCGCTGAAHSN